MDVSEVRVRWVDGEFPDVEVIYRREPNEVVHADVGDLAIVEQLQELARRVMASAERRDNPGRPPVSRSG